MLLVYAINLTESQHTSYYNTLDRDTTISHEMLLL